MHSNVIGFFFSCVNKKQSGELWLQYCFVVCETIEKAAGGGGQGAEGRRVVTMGSV